MGYTHPFSIRVAVNPSKLAFATTRTENSLRLQHQKWKTKKTMGVRWWVMEELISVISVISVWPLLVSAWPLLVAVWPWLVSAYPQPRPRQSVASDAMTQRFPCAMIGFRVLLISVFWVFHSFWLLFREEWWCGCRLLSGCLHTRKSLQTQHRRRSLNQNEWVFSVFFNSSSAFN